MKAYIKKYSLVLAAFMLLSCTSCAEYVGATRVPGTGGGGNSGDSSIVEGPTLNDDPTDDFTVTVLADGEPYTPRTDMKVYWRDKDGSGLFVAPLNKHGEARVDGLDGDYQVTISGVPNEYSYDPNAYVATNDNKNIEVNLYSLNRLTGSGTSVYDCYKFSKVGVYSAVIEDASDAIYFEYAPDKSGEYSVESWVDVAEDNIDPWVEVYIGSSHWHPDTPETILTDGGPAGSYTSNFVYTLGIAKEMISGGGQATYTFAVKATTKNDKYPVTITFAVKRNGNFDLWGDEFNKENYTAVPKFDFSSYNIADHTYGKDYKRVYPEIADGKNPKLAIFDDDLFQIDKRDGFYHVYDEEKYADNGGYGPILYANISSNCRFLDRAFSNIEYKDGVTGEGATTQNNALTVYGVNYKHFIEGYDYLTTYGNINGGSYYCVSACACHANKLESTGGKLGWACTKDCTKCHVDCRRIPEELVGKKGYKEYANPDGAVAVTEELKEFLSAYCDKAKYFYDGQGYVEGLNIDGKSFQAEGGSGWLFACYYYKKK